MGMRVYEFAKLCGLTTKRLLEIMHSLGLNVENHMAMLPEGAEARIKAALKSSQQSAQGEKPGVVSRASAQKGTKPTVSQQPPQATQHKQSPKSGSQRSKSLPQGSESRRNDNVRFSKDEQRSSSKERSPSVAMNVEQEPQELLVEPMTIELFAARTSLALGDVMLLLLKQGIAKPKSYVLPEELVAMLARSYGITARTPVAREIPKERGSALKEARVADRAGILRQPIVVIMGHVDHGKTTLLDTIRKTRVAAREKGGITQHVGAYEATTRRGKSTFLDTPGHAAFSMIRERGAAIADIGVLVIAADDGMKPQTIEALHVLQNAGLPIIVAINKADKVEPARLEAVKQECAQRGLVPEEWGGDTLMVSISATKGTGVDALLEMISLQAEMMELQAPQDAPAAGFVLESSSQRGLGHVATVIMRRGIVRIGDYFTSGNTQGKISSLLDAYGHRIKEALPAVPVLIAGFETPPQVGQEIHVVASLHERTADQREKGIARQIVIPASTPASMPQGAELKVVLKADTMSSLQAIEHALTSKHITLERPIKIVHQAVGLLSESDVLCAADAGALLYGFHVKWEARGQALAQHHKVVVRLFDIIYELIDDIVSRARLKKRVEIVKKQSGEAVVLKVFDIKKMGIIAGAIVRSGLFSRDGSVKIYRGRELVGEGPIKSLQRDRKTVKEVHSGFECAFLIDGFTEWQEGDRVECYMTVKTEV